MNLSHYMVLQVDMSIRTKSGEGVLKPIHCDGHYDRKEHATEVAELMAERFPGLRTYVVQVVGEIE